MNISWLMWWKKFHLWRFLISLRRLSKKFNLGSLPEEGSFSNSSCLVENFRSKTRSEIYIGRDWSGLYHRNIGNPSFAWQIITLPILRRNVSTSRYGGSTMEWDWRHLRLTSQIWKSPFFAGKAAFSNCFLFGWNLSFRFCMAKHLNFPVSPTLTWNLRLAPSLAHISDWEIPLFLASNAAF